MSNTENSSVILNEYVNGFHQYSLVYPVHLEFVSQNLCTMLGVSENELLSENNDLYKNMVHPGDLEQYSGFICDLSKMEQTLTLEYRLIKKDGTIIYVLDTVTSKKIENSMVGFSVLTDITAIKNENNHLQLLNETIPCGFLKYTCEKQPKLTYINKTMIDILRFPKINEGELDYFDLYNENVFLMIPMEERRRFSKYLNRIYTTGTPISGEMSLLRCDGTRAYVFGWVVKTINEQGVEEFQSVCMDITSQYHKKQYSENKRYIKALSEVYDDIFEFDITANTVKCIYCNERSSFNKFKNIAMRMNDALDKYIMDNVDSKDRDKVRSFFGNFCQKNLDKSSAKPPQMYYTAKSSDGNMNQYVGIFIQLDDNVSLYCCRRVQCVGDTDKLRAKTERLEENMKELVTQFFDGIAAFEITIDDKVKPLYASENVCEFFGYTREKWLPLTEKYTSIESFVAYSEAPYVDFEDLLKNGEAEFTYFDYATETERKIKAVCSFANPNSYVSRYVMLYSVKNSENANTKASSENRTVSIRTFGYFDVFVGDKPIIFRNKKSQELFALLVDRKGGYVTSEEAVSFLWEDEPADSVTLSRYRKVALRLKNTLEEYGISDVIESVDGKRRIVTEKVQCDLYQYLSGKEEYSQLFKGSYLTNYSWGETTLGELSNEYIK